MCFKCFLTRKPHQTVETTDYWYNKDTEVPTGKSSNTWFFTNPLNTPKELPLEYVLMYPDINNTNKNNYPAVLF